MRSRPITKMLIASLSLLTLLVASARAGWVPNGNRLRPESFTNEGEGIPLSLTSDGAGAAFLVSGTSLSARLMRLLASGSASQEYYFSEGVWWPGYAEVVPDGMGGAYVVSNDVGCSGLNCAGNFSWVRVHHVGSSGVTAGGWSGEGVDIGSGGEPGYWNRQVASISDERGGVFITWSRKEVQDRYEHPRELRIQRVNPDGSIPWGLGGTQLRGFSSLPFSPTMVSDGFGGAFVFWLDERAPGVYGQHVSAEGRLLWTAGGIPIGDEPVTALGHPVAISDGSHGAIVAWSGNSTQGTGVFAVRVTPLGSLPWRGHREIFRATTGQVDGLKMVAAEHGGALLGWRQSRDGSERILAQRLDQAGRRQWTDTGVPVCAASGARDQMEMASDLQSGAYFAWADSRPTFAVYGMHLDAAGRPARGWSRDGEPVAARFTRQPIPGGMSAVTSLEMTTIISDHFSPPFGLNVRGVRSTERHSPASAMLVWVDDRTAYSGFSMSFAFTMLLEPGGPAARAMPEIAEPVLASGEAVSPRLSVSGTRDGVLRVSFSGSAPATLELFDVSGRKVMSRGIASPTASVMTVRLGEDGTLPPGVYLARVTQGTHVANARVAILH